MLSDATAEKAKIEIRGPGAVNENYGVSWYGKEIRGLDQEQVNLLTNWLIKRLKEER